MADKVRFVVRTLTDKNRVFLADSRRCVAAVRVKKLCHRGGSTTRLKIVSRPRSGAKTLTNLNAIDLFESSRRRSGSRIELIDEEARKFVAFNERHRLVKILLFFVWKRAYKI